MKTPFSQEQFFSVFEAYNTEVFPMQIVILALGFIALLLLKYKHRLKDKFIGAFLGFIWLWAGIVYQIIYFSPINQAAMVFGMIFIIQGILLLLDTFAFKRLAFSFNINFSGGIGAFLVIFGLLIYPLIGWLIERSVPHIISAGLPFPTVIITFGFFALATTMIRWYSMIIPFIWAIISLGAVTNFGIYQDYMLIISAIVVALLLFFKNKAEIAGQHPRVSPDNSY